MYNFVNLLFTLSYLINYLGQILKHMTEFAQSIRTSHDGKSLGQEVEKTCGRTRRAGRFMNLWFSKCEGYHKPKIMTAFFDMLE